MNASPTPTDDTADTQPADTQPAETASDTRFGCPYCAREFTKTHLRALHMGWEHTDDLDTAEREAFEDAYESETEELRLFRLKLVFALVVLYFAFLFLFAAVT